MIEHVSQVVSALPDRCRMFYAMKANSAEPLLRALAPLVAGFEVASSGELAKARAVDQHIPLIVGGPAKTEEGIAQALAQRVTRFHAESVLELHRISAVERCVPAHWREIDFECSRFLVAACGYYAVEVLDIKRNHGVNYLVVRGGTHHFRLPASWQHSHPFTVVALDRWPLRCPRPEVRDQPVTVVGELCTPKDVLARDVVVPRVRAGDVLVFHHAGAYGWEISHHDFLTHPHPNHVFLRKAPSPRSGCRLQ